MAEWVKLIIENPGSSLIGLIAAIMAIVYVVKSVMTIQAMQLAIPNLVTKQDLVLSLSNFRLSLDDLFVVKKDYIPLEEHIRLTSRVETIERILEQMRERRG